MNSRTRFLTRTRRLALLSSLFLFGLLVRQEQSASLAQTSSQRLAGNGSGALISAGLPSSIRLPASASGSDRASAAQPNQFDLRDAANHAHITYSTSGVDGRPHLDYTDQRLHRSYAGKEIRVVPSEIGALVSVTLEQVPDLHTITLTLLVPAINVQATRTNLSTRAILTTHRTTIGGPALVKGAVQTYRILTLQGTASLVVF